MTQVSDTFTRSERKQQTIRKLVEEKDKGKKGKKDSPTQVITPQTDRQSGGTNRLLHLVGPCTK